MNGHRPDWIVNTQELQEVDTPNDNYAGTDTLRVECGECAAWIEAVPSKPKDQSTGCANNKVMWLHRRATVALEDSTEPGPESDRAGERDSAANSVNDRRSREIVEGDRSHNREPSVRTPCPVADDRIDEAR